MTEILVFNAVVYVTLLIVWLSVCRFVINLRQTTDYLIVLFILLLSFVASVLVDLYSPEYSVLVSLASGIVLGMSLALRAAMKQN